MALAAAALGALLPAPLPASAAAEVAARGGDVPGLDRDAPSQTDEKLTRGIQQALADLGLYFGPVNGRMSGNLDAVIRNYQRQAGLNTDGGATEQLLAHIERAVSVTKMLKVLESSRKKEADEARRALMSHPATWELLEDREVAVADAARNPAKCFDKPTVRCLLAEAYESAKAVHKQDLRDWAMDEILTAQARAGLNTNAMETTRRIKDPRLMMGALRKIATAQARARRHEQALAAAEIIPEKRTQVQALAEIADAQTERGVFESAKDTAARLLAMAQHLKAPIDRVTFATKAAVTLHQAGDTVTASRVLDLARKMTDTKIVRDSKPGAWLQVAGTLAELDQVEEALRLADMAKVGRNAESEEILDHTFDDAVSVHLPFARSYAVSRLVLALAARARIPGASKNELAKHFAHARRAAEGIKKARLRAQVLFEIAAWQMRAGLPRQKASITLDTAIEASKKVLSPFRQVGIHAAAAMHARPGETSKSWAASDRGMTIAREIETPWPRARSLVLLSQTLLDLAAPKAAKGGDTASGSPDHR
ncbi:MAG: peptidoglycan-binding domain-containing protein [Rhodospirillaceae bacterium]